MAVYYVGLIALIAALVVATPLYGFFAFTGYLHAVPALRGWWRMAGVAVTAMFSALAQIGGYPTLLAPGGGVFYVMVAIFNIGVAGAMSVLALVSTEQSVRRKQMIVELAEANAKLEAAMAENEGLHAQLLTQAREAGVLDERARMAEEIHDTIAQGLTGIVTQLQAAEGSAQWQRHVRTAAQLARDSLTEARRSVQALRPRPLATARLPEALAEVARDWSVVNGVPADVTVTGAAEPLLPEIEVALLRTAQEALANVAKHAGASRVGLTLSYMEDLVTLDVRDDGTGFSPEALTGEGFGLTVMRERVRRIAGRLAIESEPGAGTAVSACVPAIVAGGTR
jgi:signal transduction histidine kinase